MSCARYIVPVVPMGCVVMCLVLGQMGCKSAEARFRLGKPPGVGVGLSGGELMPVLV